MQTVTPRRRLRRRQATARCDHCGSELTVRPTPKAYLDRVWGRQENEVAWRMPCCDEGELVITVGAARRA